MKNEKLPEVANLWHLVTKNHESVDSGVEGGLGRRLCILFWLIRHKGGGAMGENEFFLQRKKQQQK